VEAQGAFVTTDGVNSLLAQKAGLRPDLTPHEIGAGVKGVIELPAATIESRFHIGPDEGAARMIMGGSRGVNGGAFLYTNRASISLGCVFQPATLAAKGAAIHDLLQDIKMHPAIYPLIEGGRRWSMARTSSSKRAGTTCRSRCTAPASPA